jgi:hypothetical protein
MVGKHTGLRGWCVSTAEPSSKQYGKEANGTSQTKTRNQGKQAGSQNQRHRYWSGIE